MSDRKPPTVLTQITALLKRGQRGQAVAKVRLHGKTVAWAESVVSAIEWALATERRKS